MTGHFCESDCKYQKEGRCLLERADWVRGSSDGAECLSHIFEKEKECRC